MIEPTNETPKKPGIVIFVSILNFFSSTLWFFITLLFSALLVLGNSASFYQQVTSRLQERLPAGQNIAVGWNVVFSFFVALGLFFSIYHLFLGIGLLKGKGAAWYVQIVTAILGLIMIPYGTIISIIILIFFFRTNVRGFFKV